MKKFAAAVAAFIVCWASLAVLGVKFERYEWFKAARYGDVKTINALLRKNPGYLRIVDDKGRTALHYASEAGFKATVEALIEAGADANAADPLGLTPLHLAAREGFMSASKTLVAAGANINAKDAYGNAPLHLAVTSNNFWTAKLLIDAGADVGAADSHGLAPLHLAAARNMFGEIEALVAMGASPDVKDGRGLKPASFLPLDNNKKNVELKKIFAKSGDGALDEIHAAASDGDAARIAELIKAFPSSATAEIVEGPERGARPVNFALKSGNAAAIELFLNASNVNENDVYGYPLLTATAAGGKPDIKTARFLIDKGADLNVPTPSLNKAPALAYFAKENMLDYVELMIAKGVDLSVEDPGDASALRYALSAGAKESATLLFSRKPLLEFLFQSSEVHNSPEEKKRFILNCAKRYDKDLFWKIYDNDDVHRAALAGDAAAVRKELDDEPNFVNFPSRAKETEGGPPLFFAIAGGREDVVELLLAKGADPNLETSKGTPLSVAEKLKRTALQKLLTEEGAFLR